MRVITYVLSAALCSALAALLVVPLLASHRADDSSATPLPPQPLPESAPGFSSRLEPAHAVRQGTCDGGHDGTLRCSDAPIDLIFSALTARYGIRFLAGDANIAERRLSVTIPPMSVDNAAHALERILGGGTESAEAVIVLLSRSQSPLQRRDVK